MPTQNRFPVFQKWKETLCSREGDSRIDLWPPLLQLLAGSWAPVPRPLWKNVLARSLGSESPGEKHSS